MAKIPNKPEEIFTEFTTDFQTAFGDDLVSIILYGSGAKGDYVRGRSDINFLIVLKEQGIGRLDTLSELVARWRKRKVATPLFMSKTEICSSVDSYPIEFLNLKRHYRVVVGEDVLAGLVFDPGWVRMQCERELKGKSLLLLQRFIETEGSTRRLRELISVSITAFISIFRALLFLEGVEIPENKREVVRKMREHYGIDLDTFIKCIDVKEGILTFSKGEIREVFFSCLREIRALSDRVDQMKEKCA